MIYIDSKKVIYQQHPLRGIIRAIQTNIALINIGSDEGVLEADEFYILDPNVIRGRKNTIGRIKVMNSALSEKSAECEILVGRDLTEGLKIEADIKL